MKKINTSHILVEHKYQAEDLEKKLKAGADFAQLAQKHSLCSSSQQGGWLGLQPLVRLDTVYAETAEQLKPNQISSIVRTRFGYHLIYRHADDKVFL